MTMARFSMVVPVRFRTRRGRYSIDGSIVTQRVSWWQWRGRVFRYRTHLTDKPFDNFAAYVRQFEIVDERDDVT